VLAFQVLALSFPITLFGHVVSYNVLMPLGLDRVINVLAWTSAALMVGLSAVLVPEHGARGMAIAVLAAVGAHTLMLVAYLVRSHAWRTGFARLRRVGDAPTLP
jgi:O-antigen/teichoic acid export membrane protein